MEEENFISFPLQLDISVFCDSEVASHFIDFSLLEYLIISSHSDKEQKPPQERKTQTNRKRKCSDLSETNETFTHRGKQYYSYEKNMILCIFNSIQQTYICKE